MKKSIILLAYTLFIANAVFAQCTEMFDYREGTTWEWSNYDKKGKLVGKTVQKIDQYNESANGFTATMSTYHTDKKGEQTPTISMDMTCKDGTLYFDMKNFLPEEYLDGSDGQMNLEVNGDNLETPSNLQVGEALKDASVSMKIAGEDSPIGINMKVEIFNRKVEAKEHLETPAGKFNCFVITQTIKTKTIVSVEMNSKNWYSPGVGNVKSETYRKGKLTGYTLLTLFNK